MNLTFNSNTIKFKWCDDSLLLNYHLLYSLEENFSIERQGSFIDKSTGPKTNILLEQQFIDVFGQ